MGRQPRLGRSIDKLFTHSLEQATLLGSDPDRAFGVLADRANRAAGETFGVTERIRRLTTHAVDDAAVAPDPDRTIPSRINDINGGPAPKWQRDRRLRGTNLRAKKFAGRSKPDVARGISADGQG